MLTACDAVPGLNENGNSAPHLFGFTMAPTHVVFEDLPAEQIIADTLARLPLSLSVRVEDAQDDISEVAYLIRAPFSDEEPFASGLFAQAVGNRYDADFLLDIPRGGVGTYDVVVYATDSRGGLSNQARGRFEFEVTIGSPPVIERIEAPDTFTPPGTLTMVAVVSDPDGLNNIRQVLVATPNGAELPMFDDGVSQEDEVARDGRYTVSFNVTSASPGPQTFRFRAVDRSGLVSETVEKTITIQG
jgi:hypothetical protein